jgi:hypothetical protein
MRHGLSARYRAILAPPKMNLYLLATLKDNPERAGARTEALIILVHLQAANQLTPDKVGWPDLFHRILGAPP